MYIYSRRKTVAVVERKNVNFGVGGGGQGARYSCPASCH